jgi:hypothetical protein
VLLVLQEPSSCGVKVWYHYLRDHGRFITIESFQMK